MQENKDSPVQEPTIGRIVHYFDPHARIPMPAMVQAVTPGSLTIPCLHVYRHDGTEVMEYVDHISDTASMMPRWDWMPYQKGQAAKTEALEKELRTVGVSPGSTPVQLTVEEEIALMTKSVGKDAQQGLASLHRSRVTHDDELSKNQASVPSREDGKR